MYKKHSLAWFTYVVRLWFLIYNFCKKYIKNHSLTWFTYLVNLILMKVHLKKVKKGNNSFMHRTSSGLAAKGVVGSLADAKVKYSQGVFCSSCKWTGGTMCYFEKKICRYKVMGFQHEDELHSLTPPSHTDRPLGLCFFTREKSPRGNRLRTRVAGPESGQSSSKLVYCLPQRAINGRNMVPKAAFNKLFDISAVLNPWRA